MSVRPYEPSDRETLSRIWSAAFAGGRRPKNDEPEIRPDSPIFVCEREGRLVGGFRIHEIQHTFRGCSVLSGGVAAVAVSPDRRQQGVGREMMLWAIDYLRNRRVPFASLHAFSENYYRQFGYECCGQKIEIRCDRSALNAERIAVDSVQLSASDFPLLEPCYSQFADRYNGMIRRTEWWWKRALNSDAQDRQIFAFGDPVEAYAVVKFTSDFYVDQKIEECVWSTRRGYDALMALFAGIAVNRSHISWFEPADGPAIHSRLQQGCSFAVKPAIMFRLVSLAEALQSLPVERNGEFTMQIEDALIEANRGPWSIRCSSGQLQLEPAQKGQIRISERKLVQALFGQPSFENLLRAGDIEVESRAAAREAARLFSAQQACCIDFF